MLKTGLVPSGRNIGERKNTVKYIPLGYTQMGYLIYMPIELVFEFWDIPKSNHTLLRIGVII